MPKRIYDNFWDAVEKGAGCWVWRGGLYSTGYGRYREELAHRYAWREIHGKIPDGYYICHKCDNRLCVRPDHLFLGTPQDNRLDAKQKGRDKAPPILRGSHAKNSKLNEHQVREIRQLRQSGMKQKDLAQRFGVSETTIRAIVYRRTWAWLPVKEKKA